MDSRVLRCIHAACTFVSVSATRSIIWYLLVVCNRPIDVGVSKDDITEVLQRRRGLLRLAKGHGDHEQRGDGWRGKADRCPSLK